MVFLLCLLLLIIAPLLHIILCSLNITGRIRMPIILITLVCVVLGIVLSLLATYIDIMNLPPGVKCATPSIGFVFLGIALTISVIPVSTIIFAIIAHYKRKRVSTAGLPR